MGPLFTSSWLLLVVCLALEVHSGGLSPCSRRIYLAKAEQADEMGRRCWDTVKVPACGGRCDSREISDWEFPFKKSYHPVCVYGSRKSLVVYLRNCDPGVTSGTDVFHFVAAENCRCKVCSSQYTSCEWLPPNATVLTGIADDYDYEELDY
ncbi:thyrostimulin beta-5 subunit-like [Manduca sexta]|uniref:thyrostimulin beta-5 subunit-like n=1 Tax=Manduca sexta TaxID=7130 RepID=UPI0011833802|nr:thyrostimulin beta-5 subunit-like [Manduca sexta]